jgi:DNA-binding transcriptional ArsR family regulator
VADDQGIIGALHHPLRRRILKHTVEKGEPVSPDQVAKELGERLNNVSYHVCVLRDSGALMLVDRKPVRGSVQHYYVHNQTVTAVAWVREALGLPADRM